MFEKIYLVIFLLIYFVVVFLIPVKRVIRNIGVNPYVFKKTDSAHDFLGKVSTPIMSLIFVMSLVNLIYPAGLQYLAPFYWLIVPIVEYTGFFLIHLSLLWIIIAQLQMNNSWRIGIDHLSKTELKTNGLFSISRNPVFLGMLSALLGIFFIIPNALTIVVFVSSTLLFQVQVRLEEEYLYKTHGDRYIAYCQKTRRWI